MDDTKTAAPAAPAVDNKRKAEDGKGVAQQQQKKKQDPTKAKMGKLFGSIAQHAKHNRLVPALAELASTAQENMPLNLGLFNTLLYLATGGNNWELYARGREVPPTTDTNDEVTPAPSKDELIAAAGVVWDRMQACGVAGDNVTYTSLARIEAIKGNAAGALQWAQKCATTTHPVQLRLYHPAIVSFILTGDVASVLATDAEITAYGRDSLDLTEQEYALLLEAVTLHGDWAQVTGVLRRIGAELNQLAPPTVALISAYFESPRAACAFAAGAAATREEGVKAAEARLRDFRAKEAAEAAENVIAAVQRAANVPARRVRPPGPNLSGGGKLGLAGLAAAAAKAAAAAPPIFVEEEDEAGPRHTGSPSATAPASPSHASTQQPGGKGGGERGGAAGAGEGSGSPSSMADADAAAAATAAAAADAGASAADAAAADAAAAAAALAKAQEPALRRPWLSYPASASRWHVAAGQVPDKASGVCQAAGAPLEVVDLEEEEWASFAKAVAKLAMSQEQRKSDFQAYIDWYERNGPFDLLIDGANVAYYGQNRDGGGFNWTQIMQMSALVREQHPDKKFMLMLHRKRTSDAASQRPEVRAFLDELKSQRAFYHTPPGSNDDWYWLYATVRARSAGLLISNDELRDHIWGMLRPKHFLKWKSSHIAHYSFAADGRGGWRPVVHPPPPYTECTQELANGAWAFPCTDGNWLVVRPE
ncbi:hypothetical protein FOA52_015288 [Chlamydomonas sp. UWO 241]|nr:hypothetical protein FOA52_015288 [Chlamydomonas sp. UWO 241]